MTEHKREIDDEALKKISGAGKARILDGATRPSFKVPTDKPGTSEKPGDLEGGSGE